MAFAPLQAPLRRSAAEDRRDRARLLQGERQDGWILRPQQRRLVQIDPPRSAELQRMPQW